MIKDDMTPYTYRIRFFDDDVERIKYSDDRRYYERLVGLHGHLSDLRVEAVTLTTEQKQRLGAIKDEGLSGHDASVYVRFGTTESEDTGYFDADKLLTYRKNQVEPKIKAQRKAAEALGVVSSGIRYALLSCLGGSELEKNKPNQLIFKELSHKEAVLPFYRQHR